MNLYDKSAFFSNKKQVYLHIKNEKINQYNYD